MRIKNPPIIIDNTAISNFGLINKFDILEKLYPKNIIIPTNVIAESIVMSSLESCVQAALKAGWMEEYTLDYKGRNELMEYAQLRRQFGDGESAVMAIAKTWRCAVASDDMRATRKFCLKHEIEQIGSLGILFDAYDSKIVNVTEANKVLTDMINIVKYKCPIENFNNVIDWFKNGIGKELF